MADDISKSDLTVLNDWGESSHREIAAHLLPQLREEMPEEEYYVDFLSDLRSAVLDAILRDLEANLEHDDWLGMGFEEPADFLDAEAVADVIGNQAAWYFEDDQIGKSMDVFGVILDYAEEYDLVERKSE